MLCTKKGDKILAGDRFVRNPGKIATYAVYTVVDNVAPIAHEQGVPVSMYAAASIQDLPLKTVP